jgi:hypothetical protein
VELEKFLALALFKQKLMTTMAMAFRFVRVSCGYAPVAFVELFLIAIFTETFFQTPPEAFASKLLAWFRDEHDLDAQAVKVLVDDPAVQSSSSSSECKYPKHIGCQCCPF